MKENNIEKQIYNTLTKAVNDLFKEDFITSNDFEKPTIIYEDEHKKVSIIYKVDRNGCLTVERIDEYKDPIEKFYLKGEIVL